MDDYYTGTKFIQKWMIIAYFSIIIIIVMNLYNNHPKLDVSYRPKVECICCHPKLDIFCLPILECIYCHPKLDVPCLGLVFPQYSTLGDASSSCHNNSTLLIGDASSCPEDSNIF